MLAADDPGFGFYASQQAEAVVLVQQAEVCARGEIVAPFDVIIDFHIRRGNGEGLGVLAQAPAAAGSARNSLLLYGF